MPIFEYLCKPCGETYEEYQDAPVQAIACPNCGKAAARKPSNFSSRIFTERMASNLSTQLKRRPTSYKDVRDLMGDGEIISKEEYLRNKTSWNYDKGNGRQTVEEGIRVAKERLENPEYRKEIRSELKKQTNWDLVGQAVEVK